MAPKKGSKFPPRSKEHCEKIRQRMMGNVYGVGKKRSDEFKENQSQRMMGNDRGKFAKGKKPLTSERMKRLWSDPDYRDKQAAICIKALNNGISNFELKIQSILDDYFPGEWKFVGNGDFILAGKCPDFVNVNGKKLIIEVFGHYTHTILEGIKRKSLFRKYGYNTLIINRKELRRKDYQPIVEKILEFNNLN